MTKSWQLDAAHTSFQASAKHMMLTTVHGRFAGVTGELDFDPARPQEARIELRIPAATIDTGEPRRDAHLRSADFLDAERHPDIVFRSTSIKPDGRDAFSVRGDLTIRGITKPIEVTVEPIGVIADPQAGERAAFDASATIDRREWGLVWNMPIPGGVLVSEKVKIQASLAAVPAVAQTLPRAA